MYSTALSVRRGHFLRIKVSRFANDFVVTMFLMTLFSMCVRLMSRYLRFVREMFSTDLSTFLTGSPVNNLRKKFLWSRKLPKRLLMCNYWRLGKTFFELLKIWIKSSGWIWRQLLNFKILRFFMDLHLMINWIISLLTSWQLLKSRHSTFSKLIVSKSL